MLDVLVSHKTQTQKIFFFNLLQTLHFAFLLYAEYQVRRKLMRSCGSRKMGKNIKCEHPVSNNLARL